MEAVLSASPPWPLAPLRPSSSMCVGPRVAPVVFRRSHARSILSLRRDRRMRCPRSTRTCKHYWTCVAPDPRHVRRQRSCTQPACRQASKAASQRLWSQPPHNRDGCRGPTQVKRVRQWRQTHPTGEDHTCNRSDGVSGASLQQSPCALADPRACMWCSRPGMRDMRLAPHTATAPGDAAAW